MDTPNIDVPRGPDPVSPGRTFSLKLRGGETGDSIMLFEETVPAGTKSTFHLHHDSDEVAYVLSGEVTFKIGDQLTVCSPDSCALTSQRHFVVRCIVRPNFENLFFGGPLFLRARNDRQLEDAVVAMGPISISHGVGWPPSRPGAPHVPARPCCRGRRSWRRRA